MEYLNFGDTDLTPSKIGISCNSIASVTRTSTLSETKKTLLRAFDEGVNFFDTADIYSLGKSEKLLGQLFKGKREQVIFCSKGGRTPNPSQKFVRLLKPVVNPLTRYIKPLNNMSILKHRFQNRNSCYDPAYLYQCIKDSLTRLQTDYLDIYLLHGTSQEALQNQQVFTMLEHAKQKGLIRYYGISTAEPNHALYCLENYKIDCLQIPVNLFRQDMINEIIPRAVQKGIGIISREPYAKGQIYTNQDLIELCKNWHLPMDQIALQYLLSLKDSGIILINMVNNHQLNEILNLLKNRKLTDGAMGLLKYLSTESSLKSQIVEG